MSHRHSSTAQPDLTLMMLAFWGLLVAAVLALVRGMRGEIDADDHRARRELLRSGR